MTYLDALLTEGLPMTLLLTFGAYAFGIVGGLVLMFGRRSGIRVVQIISIALIDALRAIPPIAWLFIVFFGIGSGSLGFQFTGLGAGLIGMGMIASGYLAEVFRGAVLSVPRGQWESAQAVGLSRVRTFLDIIGPQAFRVAIPAAATYLIGLFKDTSIISTIGVAELAFLANREALESYEALYAFGIVGLIYIAISIPTAWGTRMLDHRLRRRVAR